MSDIGQRIVRFREKRGWTQKSFAERVGIRRSKMCRIEKDQVELRIGEAADIAKALGVCLGELVNRRCAG